MASDIIDESDMLVDEEASNDNENYNECDYVPEFVYNQIEYIIQADEQNLSPDSVNGQNCTEPEDDVVESVK